MRAKFLWRIVGVIVVVAVLAGGWFLFISPKLDEASSNDAFVAEVQAQNANLQIDVANLSTVDADALRRTLTDFSASIPSLPEFTDYMRGVYALSTSAGTALTSIDFTDPEVFTPAVAGSAGADVATPAPVGPVDPAAPPAPVPLPISQGTIDAAVSAGLLISRFTIVIDGTIDTVVAMAQSLQKTAPRSTLITGLTLVGSDESDNKKVTATLQGAIWILPLDIPTSTPTPSA